MQIPWISGSLLDAIQHAGDLSAHQVGLALHVDVKAAVACADGGLLAHALVVAVDFGGSQVQAAAHARTHHDRAAHLLAAVFVGVGVS